MHLKPSFAYSIITGIIASMVYLFTSFASVRYVDSKHGEVKESLQEIKSMLHVIDDRLYELKSIKGDK